jgi:hypothetical protein
MTYSTPVAASAGTLDPAGRGPVRRRQGTFFGDDLHDGRPVRVHFEWKGITPASALWQQAFSPDQGETWETNWVMTLSRQESG